MIKHLKLRNHRTAFASAFACAALALTFSPQLFAVPYAEQGDAGDLPASAQITSGTVGTTLTSITGTITSNNGITEGDMFAIFITNPITFSASTTTFGIGVNNFDTQLFLFNAAGLGVYANDDDPTTGSSQSTLPAGNTVLTSLPSGLYYILITGSGRYPIDSMGQLIFPNFTDGTTDPTGVYGRNPTSLAIAGFTGNSNEGGKYSIALTGAQFVTVVPEPSTIALALLGLGGMAAIRRRRTKI